MMKLTPELRAEMIERTKGAAAAIVDDLLYIRKVVSESDLSNGDIRRLSSLLRRIIVESDLSAVAAPRIGRVEILGPDNSSAYRAEKKLPFMFFMSGRATILGGWSGTIFAFDVAVPKIPGVRLAIPTIETHTLVELSLDSFRHQKVLCYRGKWATRQAVIKYVANVASGVHSGSAKNDDDQLLSYVRNGAKLRKDGSGGIHLDLFPLGVDVDDASFRHRPDAIDPLLIELLAAAKFLVEAPSVQKLEECIEKELRA